MARSASSYCLRWNAASIARENQTDSVLLLFGRDSAAAEIGACPFGEPRRGLVGQHKQTFGFDEVAAIHGLLGVANQIA
jgi:hypothetical protein